MSAGNTASPATPVALLMARVTEWVDAWRGFPLPRANEAWGQPGVYQPNYEGECAVSDTTAQLLRHWFRPFPHELPGGGLFRYWPHQRRFVETVIYLHEVCGIRSVDALYDAFEVPRGFEAFDPWPKLGGQLATGSGKTKMMSLLVAWSVLNALREGAEHLGMGPQAIIVAPGLFVKERLLFDFSPDGRPSVFRADPVIPPALERDWRLPVYGPDTAPLRLDPRDPALIVTNVHQLFRQPDPPPVIPREGIQGWLAFETAMPKKLEDTDTPLLARFRRGPGVLVLNDEAHHVGDEPAHQRFEKAAANKLKAGDEGPTELAWIRSLRTLHQQAGLGLQVDLSATLYEERGGARTARSKASESGAPAPFRHTVVDYPLREAILDGVVKYPILERVRAVRGEVEESPVREGQPNAWLTYEPLLRAGIERWCKVRDELAAEGDTRKPILFLICANSNEAQEITNQLTYGEASREKLDEVRQVTGFVREPGADPLFVEDD
ncbi:MAG: DEAD/DEAH box helicase family protein, partial [Myxococcales bacterium]|nr:DEAD/DEAH box helicase family protein [Myxococcales bacterium]